MDYAVTGVWSEKAAKEAGKYGSVSLALNTKNTNHTTIPEMHEWKLDSQARYLHYCANETVHGVEFPWIPKTLPDVPLILDFAKSPEDRQVMEVFLSQKVAARPVLAPPDVPAERVKALRAAFIATAADPEFIQDAEKSRLEVSPTPGEDVERIVVFMQRARNEAVVARVVHGGIQHAIELELSGILVELVLVARARRNLDDRRDQLRHVGAGGHVAPGIVHGREGVERRNAQRLCRAAAASSAK